MKFRDFFKKNKVETGLSQYTMGELESLKSMYESQLEEFNSPMSYDFHDVNLGSDFCVSAFDGNAHIKNQIQRDVGFQDLTQLMTRKFQVLFSMLLKNLQKKKVWKLSMDH